MITLSIDVTLLDKARFKEVTRKNGKVAKFCELVLIDTPNGPHGDFMVKQSITKEERAARLEMPILGNGKTWAKQRVSNNLSHNAPTPDNSDDPVPF